jgi:glucose-1-phosphate thymidylyltransferase
MKGIILHGGAGTRLRPLTHTGPKQLIPIANKPISQYVLEDLIEADIKRIAILLGDIYPEKVRDHYGDGARFNAEITYINQGEPKGIAHAISLCKEYVQDEPFIVYLGDNLLKGGIVNYTQEFRDSDFEAMILLCKVENPQRFGVAKLNDQGKLVGLVEKPKQPPSNFALTGIYFLKPIIFEAITELKPSWRGELEITEALQLLIEKGYSVGYQMVEDWWKDTGAPEDILEANRLVLDELKPQLNGTIEDKNSIQGRVTIEKSTRIKQGALVRGPAIIGRNTTIEPQVYIGPYTSIGNDVIIKRGEIENSIVMDDCQINAKERITDSLIASHSRITSRNGKPRARRFILGEGSYVEL